MPCARQAHNHFRGLPPERTLANLLECPDVQPACGWLPRPMSTDDTAEQEALLARLKDLRAEHRDLDDAIEALLERPTFNHLQIQRMKKRKLRLRDEINSIESRQIPDIIA